jgi:hypothetical protein
MFDLFEVVWGLRNATDHGADPATQRMIRLTKAERAIRRLYRAIDELPSHERFPLVTRWKIYSPKLLLLRNAGSLTPKLTYQDFQENQVTEKASQSRSRGIHLEFIGTFVGFLSLHVFSQFPLESCRSSQARRILSLSCFFHFTSRGRLRLT